MMTMTAMLAKFAYRIHRPLNSSVILTTKGPKLPIRNRIWENPIIQQREEVPLMRSLGLKIPPGPALHIGLKRVHLGFDEAPRIVPHRLVPGADV